MDTAQTTATDMDFGPRMEREKPTVLFGQIPHWVIQFGYLKYMSHNDLKLLVYLGDIRYRVDGTSSRLRKHISKITGIPIRAISTHSSRLESMHIISKHRNGNRMIYVVLYVPPKDLQTPVVTESHSVRSTRTQGIKRDEEGMFKRKDGRPNEPDFTPSD